MPANITGIVFDDQNHNGIYTPGEPGIENVYIVLYNNTTTTCVDTQTDVNGDYSFSITDAGTYTIYEPVTTPDACPPTVFTQPAGFTFSNGPRKLSITVTQTQITNNETISGQDFSHDTIDDPLTCDTNMIQFAGNPTQWYNIDIVTGVPTLKTALSQTGVVNAIGYNTLDDYIYGYFQTNNRVVRVDDSGLIYELVNPTGLPSQSYNAGACDLNGHLFLTANGDDTFYTIDLQPNSPTFLKLVDPTNGFVEQTSNYGTPIINRPTLTDFVFLDDYLYTILTDGTVNRIDILTGIASNLSTTVSSVPNSVFGAIAIDFSDTIYGVANNSGDIYQYTINGSNANGNVFSQSIAAGDNDGTMCPLSNINIDYGDAPDTGPGNGPGNYSTLLASNGPRHQLGEFLYLGTQVTPELDAYQNSDATGDDLILGIQDDGLSVPLNALKVTDTSYVLSVTVTNETGSSANLYGWVDFNRNGVFQANEAAPVVVVPSQTGTQIVDLNFTVSVPLTAGDTFVRLRLTTNDLQDTGVDVDTRSIGAATDGEVEDYIVTINDTVSDLSVEKHSCSSTITTGDSIIYVIVVTNKGPDQAPNTILTDTIPADLLNPEYSLDRGNTYNPWTGSINLGTLESGDSITVQIRSTYIGTGTADVSNTATVSSDSIDPDPTNNTSTIDTPVALSADISVSKSISAFPIIAGEQLIYIITINNNGPNIAENVLLTDNIPGAIINPQYSTNSGGTWGNWVSPLSLGDISVGGSISVWIRGTINSSANGTITNTSIVNSDTPDPNINNNEDTIITTINQTADLSITKSINNNPAIPGQEIIYTITINNVGPSDAQAVTLVDEVPDILINPEYSTDGGSNYFPWVSPYTIGTLAQGATAEILIRGTVSPTAMGDIINTAVALSSTSDPNLDNNEVTNTTPLAPSADISVIKTGNPKPVQPGGILTYTLQIANAGPSSSDVVLTDPVPDDLIGVEYSTDGGSTWQDWIGSYHVGVMAGGDSQTIEIRGTVSSLSSQNIVNTASISGSVPDPDPNNNSSTDTTLVNLNADISVTKAGSPSIVESNNLLLYALNIYNAGPSTSKNVVLSDNIPSDLSGVEFSVDGGITWNSWTGNYTVGNLFMGSTVQILIRGIVVASSGIITNTAIVSSDTPDPNPNNNQYTSNTPINEIADLSITKTADHNIVETGNTLTYTIIVNNAGPSVAQNVVITDAIPLELDMVQYSSDNGITWQYWNGTYTIGSVVSGDTEEIMIRGTVVASSGIITNTAIVSSDTLDPNPTNNQDTISVSINESADLSVTKSIDINPAVAGHQIIYNILVSNAGPSNARDVLLVDEVSDFILNPEYSIDGGLNYFPWISPYTIGTLVQGQNTEILIRGIVSPLVMEQIVNTVVVLSSSADSNLDNNTVTIITEVEIADLYVSISSNVSSTFDIPIPVQTNANSVKNISASSKSDVKLFENTINKEVIQIMQALPGQVLTYTISIQNNGIGTAADVILYNTVPSELINVEFSTDDGVTWNKWVNPYRIGEIQGNTTVVILIRGIISDSACGIIENTVVVNSMNQLYNPDIKTSTDYILIGPIADLSITMITCPYVAISSQYLCYNITVTNMGPDTAENVIIEDVLSEDLYNYLFSIDGGYDWHYWNGRYNLGTIEAGATKSIIVSGIVNESAIDYITNTATVSSDTADFKSDNNSITIETSVISPFRS